MQVQRTLIDEQEYLLVHDINDYDVHAKKIYSGGRRTDGLSWIFVKQFIIR